MTKVIQLFVKPKKTLPFQTTGLQTATNNGHVSILCTPMIKITFREMQSLAPIQSSEITAGA